eukprot:2322932-Rhodomonas_salina.1
MTREGVLVSETGMPDHQRPCPHRPRQASSPAQCKPQVLKRWLPRACTQARQAWHAGLSRGSRASTLQVKLEAASLSMLWAPAAGEQDGGSAVKRAKMASRGWSKEGGGR